MGELEKKRDKGLTKRKVVRFAQGSISIMLALLLLPFFAIAAYLVEFERYQSSIALLDDSMSSAALSVLANYDPYIYERFGLMSVKHGTDVNSTFQEYLKYNADGTAKSLNFNKIAAEGGFPLSDLRILEQQVLENSKYHGVLTMADELFNLKGVISQIEGLIGAKHLFSAITSTGKTVEHMRDIAAHDKKFKDQVKLMTTNSGK